MIHGRNGPRNVPNCTSLTVVIWEAKKAKLGILLGFGPITALKSYAMRYFSWESQRNPPPPQKKKKKKKKRTEHPLHVINPKCLAHLKKISTHGKFGVAMKASFEGQKK